MRKKTVSGPVDGRNSPWPSTDGSANIAPTKTPTHLRVEHLATPLLGLGTRRPRLSWRLPAGARRQEAYALEIDGHALDRVESDASVLVAWPGAAADLPATGRLAGQGLGRRRRERLVRAGLVRDGAPRPLRLDRPLHRAPGDRAIRPRAAALVPARRGALAGEAVRDGARRLRDLPQRPARGRRRVGSGLHQLSHHPARAGLRRRCLARGRATTPGRWCSRTAGGAGAPGSSKARTASAARSPSWVSSTRTTRWSPRAPSGSRPPGRSCRPTSWRGRSRTTGRRTGAWQAVTVIDDDLDTLAYFAGTAHPPGGGAPPGRRDPSRARSPGRRPRAEHQRLAAAARPGSRRHRADDCARRVPRPVGRRHPGPPDARLLRRRQAGRHDRPRGRGRDARRGVRTASDHPRLPVRARSRATPAGSPRTTSPASSCTRTCVGRAGSAAATND